MKNRYNIKEAQIRLPALVKSAESGRMATITRRDRPVAYLMGADELSLLIETMEILANPAARAAISDAEAGRGRVYTLEEIAE